MTQKIDLKNNRWAVFGNTLYLGSKPGEWIAFPGDTETAYRLAEAHNAALDERAQAERERAARVCDRLFADDPEAALQLDGYNAALACGARIRALD